jgi:hypothetical protein
MGGKRYCDGTEYTGEIKWTHDHLKNHASNLLTSFYTWKTIKEVNKDIEFLNANPYGKLSEIFKPIALPTKEKV